MTNRKPGRCIRCQGQVPAGRGSLQYVSDDEDGDTFGFPPGSTGWLVTCLDRTACQHRRAEAAAARQQVLDAARAADALERQWFPPEEGEYLTAPDGEQMVLAGEIYARPGQGHDIYGFGVRYVDDGAWIWCVKNNGSDGADWSRNNIRTGGAGAIGCRYVRTPGRLAWLAEQENQSDLRRQRDAKEQAEKAQALTILRAAVERAGGLAALEAKLASAGVTSFAPRETPSRHYSLAECRRLLDGT